MGFFNKLFGGSSEPAPAEKKPAALARGATYYIDYENVNAAGLEGIHNLTADDKVVVCFTCNAASMDMTRVAEVCSCPASVEFLSVQAGGQSALDFQLTALLFLRFQEGCGNQYIISKDKGYDFAISLAQSQGVTNVYRQETICGEALKGRKKPSRRRRSGSRRSADEAAELEEALVEDRQAEVPAVEPEAAPAVEPAAEASAEGEGEGADESKPRARSRRRRGRKSTVVATSADAAQDAALAESASETPDEQLEATVQATVEAPAVEPAVAEVPAVEPEAASAVEPAMADVPAVESPDAAPEPATQSEDAAESEPEPAPKPKRKRRSRSKAAQAAEPEPVDDGLPAVAPPGQPASTYKKKAEPEPQPAAAPEPEADPVRQLVCDIIAADLGEQPTERQLDVVMVGLGRTQNKSAFYNYLRGNLGNAQGLEFYRNIKGSYNQLVAAAAASEQE